MDTPADQHTGAIFTDLYANTDMDSRTDIAARVNTDALSNVYTRTADGNTRSRQYVDSAADVDALSHRNTLHQWHRNSGSPRIDIRFTVDESVDV